MVERDLVVDTGDVRLPATISIPDEVRAGIVTMHPAVSPDRNSFLLANVAEILPPRGVAVLRYDRRSSVGIDDVPFAAQAADALVAAPAVSPAEQMRYGTAEQLRRNGYGDDALDELSEVRTAIEHHLRGASDRETAQAVIARYAERPWFPLTYYPTDLPSDATWQDMDFDPAPEIARVRCPVLLVYGSRDGWTPVEPSLAVWRSAPSAPAPVEILEGRGHAPVVDNSETAESVDPVYEEALLRWLDGVIG